MHVVCAWIGNTELIAAKHYLQLADDDFAAAAKTDGAKYGARNAKTAQNTAQHGACTERAPNEKPRKIRGFLRFSRVFRGRTIALVGTPLTSPPPPSSPTSVPLSFDFGTGTSPVAAGYTGVSPTTVYSAGLGYGWQSGVIDSRDRGTGGDLNRDFNFSPDGTFAVNLANGTYYVTITMGDAAYAHYQMGVFLEGLQVDSVSTALGSFSTKTYSVTVAGGQLNVRIAALGTLDANAIINGLTVSSTPLPP
jgi:hypothetical protein